MSFNNNNCLWFRPTRQVFNFSFNLLIFHFHDCTPGRCLEKENNSLRIYFLFILRTVDVIFRCYCTNLRHNNSTFLCCRANLVIQCQYNDHPSSLYCYPMFYEERKISSVWIFTQLKLKKICILCTYIYIC